MEANSTTPPRDVNANLLRYLEAAGVEMKPMGARWRGLCPLHDEKTPSFHVGPDPRLFHCFGCGAGGDVVTLHALRTGRDPRRAFREIVAELGIEADRPMVPIPKPRPRVVPFPSIRFDPAVEDAARPLRLRLYDDPELCARIAEARGWKPHTIRDLSIEIALGYDETHRALAFIYPQGIKLRAKGKRIWWAMGKASIPWRSQLLNFERSPEIIICEGETDAISMLDAGLEELDNRSVVALPSASVSSDACRTWAPLFRGKRVYLCADADEAGAKVADRIGPVIAEWATHVTILHPSDFLS